LKPVPYTWEEAVRYAKNNRLDLMNERGRVVDAWRQIEVTANAMKAGLDLKVTANVATPPGTANPVDFRAAASSYSAGVFFDGPLNRMAERNAYRAALISYQQQRRVFMALEDQIEAAIRADLRRLELERASFAIARQALITAAGQVELAYFNLRMSRPQAGTTATIDILNALQALLQAKSALLNNYISYESDRVQLLLDMEMLEIGPQGVPADEPNHNSLPGLPPIPAETAPGSRSSANPASA
jgi:outer membrane protein TolC